MNTFKYWLLATLLLPTLAFAQKEALLVTVSDYQGTKYDLQGVLRDRDNMAALFKSWGFNITHVPDRESMNLERYLQGYANLGADDHFIFYFSGHGYHTKDLNGDENDGEDETLVLSDGTKNELFLDDALYGYLNQIQAKKLVVLDSCHSGTAFKTFGDKPKPKSIDANAVNGVISTKAFRPQESKINSGEYIVFAAAQDHEEALDSAHGGLFSNAFRNQITRANGKHLRLPDLNRKMTDEIAAYCQQTDSKAHHPNFSASNKALKYSSINDFLKPQTQAKPEAKKTIRILMSKKEFRTEDELKFQLDTQGNRGYISFVSVDNGQASMVHQSNKPMSGLLNFPQDFNIDPVIEVYKSCGDCPQEISRLYAVLSETPIRVKTEASKGLTLEPISKAFREREQSFKPVMTHVDVVIY